MVMLCVIKYKEGGSKCGIRRCVIIVIEKEDFKFLVFIKYY